MPSPKRLLRETVGSTYYRQRPTEAVRFAASKLRYRSHATSPDRLLASLGFDVLRARRGLETWAPDLEAMLADVGARQLDQAPVSEMGALLLYGLVRSLEPEIVVETGVAAGVSTAFIAAALAECGHGRLVSIDLPPQAGRVEDGTYYDWSENPPGWAIPARLTDALGDRFELVLEDVRTALPRVLEAVGHVDLFVHDDLHTPDHMRWEFELVWPRLTPGGVMVSDDLNHSWTQFAAAHDLPGEAALANTDRIGALRKPR